MAIDSKQDRFAAMNATMPFRSVNAYPDGLDNAGDRFADQWQMTSPFATGISTADFVCVQSEVISEAIATGTIAEVVATGTIAEVVATGTILNCR